MAEFPEVAGHDDWARLGLHVGGQNGTERVKGRSGKELHPRVLSLYGAKRLKGRTRRGDGAVCEWGG